MSGSCELPSSSILRLLRACGPVTVLGTVVSVVVLAINRVLWRRATPHVSEEVLVDTPTWTDFNSTSAVVFPTRTLRASAPCIHPHPDDVLRSNGALPRVTVSKRPFEAAPSSEASATRRVSIQQVTPLNDTGIPAVAAAKPAEDTLSCHRFQRGQHSIASPRQVRHFWHNRSRLYAS